MEILAMMEANLQLMMHGFVFVREWSVALQGFVSVVAAIVAPGVQQLRSLQLVRLQAMPSLSAKILVLAPLALCVTAKRLVDDGAKAITLTAAEDERDSMTCKEGDPYLCGQLRDWKYLGNGQCCTSKWAECTSGDNYLCQKAGWDYLGKGQCCRTSDQKVWLTCEKVDQYFATATGHISESLTAALPSGQSARRVTSTCVGTAAKAGNTLVSHSAATPPIGKSG